MKTRCLKAWQGTLCEDEIQNCGQKYSMKVTSFADSSLIRLAEFCDLCVCVRTSGKRLSYKHTIAVALSLGPNDLATKRPRNKASHTVSVNLKER